MAQNTHFQSFCTSEDIRFLFRAANYELPASATTIKDIVLKFAKGKKDDLKAILKADLKESALSITLDEWTSTRNRRFLNVNLHKKGRFYNLGLLRVIGSCDAERFCSILTNFLMEYNINPAKDICAITTDGASVMKKFQRLMPTTPQLCYAHAIHLAVCDVIFKSDGLQLANFLIAEQVEFNEPQEEDFDEADDYTASFTIEDSQGSRWEATQNFNDLSSLLKKVRQVVKKFRKSPVLNEDVLQKHVTMDGLGDDVVLILDCQIRWSSTFLMLERFVYLRSAVDKAIYDTKGEPFSEEDWYLLQSIVHGLKAVSVTIKRLCDRSATLLTADIAISFLIQSFGSSPFEVALKSAILNRVLERRTVTSDVLQYLHNRNTTALIPEFSIVCQMEINEVIKQLAVRLCNEEPELDVHSADEEDQAVGFEKELDLLLSTETKRLTEAPRKQGFGGLATELDAYKRTGVKGPIITRLYDSLLTVSPTSVEAERTFSVAGRRCTKFRANMSDAALNALVCLHAYFKDPY